MKPFELIDSGKTSDDSFIYGCHFWLTKYPNIFVTDWDIINRCPISLIEGMKIIFKKDLKGIVYTKVSNEILQDCELMENEIDELYMRKLKRPIKH